MTRPDDSYRATLAERSAELVLDTVRTEEIKRTGDGVLPGPELLDQLDHLRAAVMVQASIIDALLPSEFDAQARATIVDRMNAIRARTEANAAKRTPAR